MVRPIILCVLLGIMAGCQAVPKGSFCTIASPIRLSDAAIDAMTDAEVSAALAHNRKGAALCRWKR